YGKKSLDGYSCAKKIVFKQIVIDNS
ncbi:MAG: hypothetical protein RLZZ312_1352, partial [Bacteroidota bacterium]